MKTSRSLKAPYMGSFDIHFWLVKASDSVLKDTNPINMTVCLSQYRPTFPCQFPVEWHCGIQEYIQFMLRHWAAIWRLFLLLSDALLKAPRAEETSRFHKYDSTGFREDLNRVDYPLFEKSMKYLFPVVQKSVNNEKHSLATE